MNEKVPSNRGDGVNEKLPHRPETVTADAVIEAEFVITVIIIIITAVMIICHVRTAAHPETLISNFPLCCISLHSAFFYYVIFSFYGHCQQDLNQLETAYNLKVKGDTPLV